MNDETKNLKQKTFKKKLFTRKAVILTVLIALILIIISLPLYVPSLIIRSYANQLYTCPLPPETEILDTSIMYGPVRGGNGRYENCVATILVKSKQTENELSEYFEEKVMSFKPISPLFMPSKYLEPIEDEPKYDVQKVSGEKYIPSFAGETYFLDNKDYNHCDDTVQKQKSYDDLYYISVIG